MSRHDCESLLHKNFPMSRKLPSLGADSIIQITATRLESPFGPLQQVQTIGGVYNSAETAHPNPAGNLNHSRSWPVSRPCDTASTPDLRGVLKRVDILGGQVAGQDLALILVTRLCLVTSCRLEALPPVSHFRQMRDRRRSLSAVRSRAEPRNEKALSA